eukprot:c1092_g1_i1.p2 GENE.c1092_g1_i1~~c1092_g1_i1.p2  ORF type:complete len:166 (+),score=48.48 c1092_g1_i1:650-1147(+)
MKNFVDCSRKVQAWDQALVANNDKITKLAKSVDNLHQDYDHLLHELTTIDSQQKSLEDTLDAAERAVDNALSQSQQQSMDVQRERRRTYEYAAMVNTQLSQMGATIGSITSTLNGRFRQAGSAETEKMHYVVEMLNHHLHMLNVIDVKCGELGGKIDEAQMALRK